METNSKSDSRAEHFRSAITQFIYERREAKLKGDNDAAKASRYEYATWLADAARRVAQIQAVTHVLKATHPDARGSSLHAPPQSLPSHAEVGSHTLGADFAEDIVGNAAALDVFKFLKVEVDGRRLWDWMLDKDADLQRALSSDSETAAEWMRAFTGLVRQDVQPISHVLAKQVYWCVGNDPADDAHYELLQPLFSSSLAHAVHANVSDARFGEQNKVARKARRDRTPYEGLYREYRDLVARKLGGTKPQNVSQLNSERGGVNYLLASAPPHWKKESSPKLLNTDSALDRIAQLGSVRHLIRVLADFLRSDPPRNEATRERRETIEQALGQELPVFAASVRAGLEPGWTRDPACRLPRCEQLWLDADRVELPVREDNAEADQAFIDDYHRGDWRDEVAGRFANWINARLRDAGLPAVGDAEYRHWAKQAVIEAQWPVPMQARAGAPA